MFWKFGHSDFEFVSDFDIRILEALLLHVRFDTQATNIVYGVKEE